MLRRLLPFNTSPFATLTKPGGKQGVACEIELDESLLWHPSGCKVPMAVANRLDDVLTQKISR
jgi:hypothetical protein